MIYCDYQLRCFKRLSKCNNRKYKIKLHFNVSIHIIIVLIVCHLLNVPTVWDKNISYSAIMKSFQTTPKSMTLLFWRGSLCQNDFPIFGSAGAYFSFIKLIILVFLLVKTKHGNLQKIYFFRNWVLDYFLRF